MLDVDLRARAQAAHGKQGERLPLNLALLIDRSGLMSGRPLAKGGSRASVQVAPTGVRAGKRLRMPAAIEALAIFASTKLNRRTPSPGEDDDLDARRKENIGEHELTRVRATSQDGAVLGRVGQQGSPARGKLSWFRAPLTSSPPMARFVP